MSIKTITDPTYFELNNQINIPVDDRIQLHKDGEAREAYIVETVKPNRVFTYNKYRQNVLVTNEVVGLTVGAEISYMDKLQWLIDNDYYEEEFIRKYTPEFIESLRVMLEDYNHEFTSFMAIYKFYKQYALITDNGEYYLEDFEDRTLANALYMGDGNEAVATSIAKSIIAKRYVPATPTLQSAGRKRRGEFASCFPAGTMITTNKGKQPIETITEGTMVLTHNKTYQKVTDTMVSPSEALVEITICGQTKPLVATPEHPILATSLMNFVRHPKTDHTEGITRHTFWTEAQDLTLKDYVAVAIQPHHEETKHIEVYRLLHGDTNGYGAELTIVNDAVAYKSIDKKNNKRKNSDVSLRTTPIPNHINLTPEFGRMLGYYLAEGSLIKRDDTILGINFTFNSSAETIINDTSEIIESVFKLTPNKHVRDDGITTLTVHNQIVGKLINKLVGSGYNHKKLTREIETAPKDVLYQLLIGVFRGDGTQTDTYNRLQLTNRPLIEQLRIVALQLGLIPYTSDLVVKYNRSDASSLTITNVTDNNVKFLNEVLDMNIIAQGVSNKNNAFILDGYVFYKVRNVEIITSSEPVYNKDVENNHTYVAENIIVHNCFITQLSDTMSDIGRQITNALQLSRKAGGVGLILGNLRSAGSPIKGKDGLAAGVVPVMKLFEDSFSYSNQLGTRPGAGVAYLPVFHADIMDFLSTKKENADEKVRLKTLSLGLTVPNKFYELVRANQEMALFDPYFIEKEYGKPFTYIDIDAEYDKLVANPNIRKTMVSARAIEQAISELQQESGYPFIINIGTVNTANPIDGRILGSNLCVTGSTRLATATGYRKAIELYGTQEQLNVTIDNRTKDNDLDVNGVSNVSAIPMHMTNPMADVYRLSTKEGYYLDATAYHDTHVLRNDEMVKVPLGEIQPGEKVFIQNGAGTFGHDSFENEAYIMGAIAGDGTFTETERKTVSKSVRLNNFNGKLNKSHHELEVQVEGMINQLHPDVIAGQSTMTPEFAHIEQLSNASLHVLQSSNLAKYLDYEFEFNKETKCVLPERLWTSTSRTIGAYLSGLLQTDGTFYVSEAYKTASVQLGNVNKQFLQEIQQLLLTLGVYSRIYTTKRDVAMLPDSNREMKEYNVQDMHSLRIQDRTDIETLCEHVELRASDIVKYHEWQSWLSSTTRKPKHNFMATVESITHLGQEPVFDTTQMSYHTLIFNGIVTSNCSEILQVQTPSVLNEEQEYEVLGQDIVCNLGSTNIMNMMTAGENFEDDIESMVRGLTLISDATDLRFVPTIEKGNQRLHAIGLGAMGLHSFLANNEIEYDSDESVEFTSVYFMLLNYYTLKASNKLAKEREPFYDFDKSDYASGKYFDKYVSHDYFDVSPKVKALFDDIYVPSLEDWDKLKSEVMEHGIYNAYRMAVAPNGSISYVNDSSASIMPIVNRIEERQEGMTGKIYYPAFGLSDATIPYYKSAFDMDMRKQIDVYAAATEHVDQGMSMNLYMREEPTEGLYEWKDNEPKMTTRDLSILRHYAFKKGIKSMYYVRTMTEDEEFVGANECESCMI